MPTKSAAESVKGSPAASDYVERTDVQEYLKGISTDRADLIRFAHYMEALVAFHRYLGGKEN